MNRPDPYEEANSAMWGWVAGAIVLALVLVFVFVRTAPSATLTVPVTWGFIV